MPEELQSLLEKIQKDGVDKAQAEADKIVADAQEKAKAIAQEADKKAKEILKKAEEDGSAFAERGKRTIEQSARDVVLAVADAINATLKGIVNREVSKALTPDTLSQMLLQVVESYCKADSSTNIEVLLNPEQQKEISDFFLQKFAEDLRKGIEIKADKAIVSGFNVSIVNEKVQHDFSAEAITEAICQLLRPHLAEIVKAGMNTEANTK